MSLRLPDFIIKALANDKTSIGDNPCLPPEEETKFVVQLVDSYFSKITKKCSEMSVEEIECEMVGLIKKCKQIESRDKTAFEKLAIDGLVECFDIPSGEISLSGKLVDDLGTIKQRLTPGKTLDYTFDSIDDMNSLTDEIYKRRVLNALVQGASSFYTKRLLGNFVDLMRIDKELPVMYSKILDYNNILLYLKKDSLVDVSKNDAGRVDVYVTPGSDDVSIKAAGVIYPILTFELIKGLFELAIAHGLPEEREKANYIITKADFKLAELWDLRLGLPLWEIIEQGLMDYKDVGANFVLMKLSMMSPKEFNKNMQEIFKQTRKGKEILRQIFEEIKHDKEQYDFDSYMTLMSGENNIISDDEYFSPEELMDDGL